MKSRYSLQTKLEVLALRRGGKTYAEIREVHPIPKSTLSYWFKFEGRTHDPVRQFEHLKKARAHALLTIARKKEERIAAATLISEKESDDVPLREISILKSLLAMLYWAEGTKSDRSSGITFVNTDPVLAQFYISLLRKAYLVDESKFRIRLHLHYYHNHSKARVFWSRQLSVPESQFGKIYVKKRSTRKVFRRNFQGICSVVYHDSSIRRELLALGVPLAQKLPSFNG